MTRVAATLLILLHICLSLAYTATLRSNGEDVGLLSAPVIESFHESLTVVEGEGANQRRVSVFRPSNPFELVKGIASLFGSIWEFFSLDAYGDMFDDYEVLQVVFAMLNFAIALAFIVALWGTISQLFSRLLAR